MVVVKVEKCDECPLLDYMNLICNHPEVGELSKLHPLEVHEYYRDKTMHKDCPLRNESISIRIK